MSTVASGPADIPRNSSRSMMTPAQLATFRADGVVIIPGLISPAQVRLWRSQLWGALTLGPDDPLPPGGAGSRNSSLFKPEYRSRLRYPYPDPAEVADPQPVTPTLGDEPHVRQVLDQLLGEGTWAAGIAAPPAPDAGIEKDTVMFRWPLHEETAAEQRMAGNDQASDSTSTWQREYHADKIIGRPHIEGYRGPQKFGPTTTWQLGITIALQNSDRGGGGTYFWPGSCHAVHRYFQKYPDDLPTGGALATSHPGSPIEVHGLPLPGPEGMTIEFMERTCPGGYGGGGAPFEAVMNKPGDAVVWHHWCVHAASANARTTSNVGDDHGDGGNVPCAEGTGSRRGARVREAILGRFHTTVHAQAMLTDDGGVATCGNLWKYFGAALRGRPKL